MAAVTASSASLPVVTFRSTIAAVTTASFASFAAVTASAANLPVVTFKSTILAVTTASLASLAAVTASSAILVVITALAAILPAVTFRSTILRVTTASLASLAAVTASSANSASTIPPSLIYTRPELTAKLFGLNDATPLLTVVANSPAIVTARPLTLISIPSPDIKSST